ncbi:MAG TPA: Uma2 family endonuclease [Methylocella sp.]|nr:Uma2 family endonuclease [Methylocella sp.]
MNAIESAHAANELARLFIRALSNDVARVIWQSPLRLDSYNEPESDLAILRPREDRYRISHPGAADLLLLIEVSDTSLAYDRATEVLL